MPTLTNRSDDRAAAVSHKRRILSSVSALSLALSFGHAALAQTAQTAQGPVEEVVVTGTHIVRDGYEAPSPLTVFSAEQINAGAREDVANYIGLLPSVIGNATAQTQSNTTNTGQTGVSSINLRGLGTPRTLVLFDGHRTVGAASDGTVDIAEFPQELIQRVDIVTGGASAAYGSDAVAGVVNFIIDKNFTGVKGSLEGGVTTYGDDRAWKATLTAGTGFANDRGHFMISGSAAHRDGLLNAQQRDWNKNGYSIMINPAYGTNAALGQSTGVPQYLADYRIGLWAATPGGIITNTALKGTAFGPGGTPYQFNFGPLIGGNYMQGGDWQAAVPLRLGTVDPESTRQTLYSRVSYDVSDNTNVYFETSWAFQGNHNRNSVYNSVGGLVVKADNAFIPASVRARMTALGLTSFNLGRAATDFNNAPGGQIYKNAYASRTMNRYSLGATGNFDAAETNWKWELFGHYGMTRTSEKSFNSAILANFNRAIDAVVSPTTGAIVCRSTLTAPGNGCVPYNVMGTEVNSQAAINYVTGTPQRNQRITQKNIAATVNGEPFSTWAGPVSVAAGVEWRKDAISGSNNAIAAAFAADAPNYQPTFGAQSVTEGFLETVIPLAKDQDWARSLDINGAVRLTEYNLSGFGTSYKVGATYQPIDDIRFRATRSHDFRAPNLGELYAGGSTQSTTIQDPFNGNAVTPMVFRMIGNPNLVPETANTTQFGVVLQPSFLPGFNASVDYWNVKVNGAVGQVTQLQTMNNCFNGLQVYCNAITRVNGVINIDVYSYNQASQHRNGLDFEAGYRFGMDDIVDSWAGDLELRVLATRYIKAVIDQGSGIPPIDYVGQVGFVSGTINYGVPEWVYNMNLTYTLDPITFTVSGHGFTGGTLDNTYIQCTSGCPVSTGNRPTISNNYAKGAFYVDLSVDYRMNDNVNLYFAVANVANLDPSMMDNISLSGASFVRHMNNPTLYDTIGRNFRAGIRFKL